MLEETTEEIIISFDNNEVMQILKEYIVNANDKHKINSKSKIDICYQDLEKIGCDIEGVSHVTLIIRNSIPNAK